MRNLQTTKTYNKKILADLFKAGHTLNRRQILALNMKSALTLLFMAITQGAQSIEVCVAPIELPTVGYRSLANPAGRIEQPYQVSVHLAGNIVEQGNTFSECFTIDESKKIVVIVKDHNVTKESFYIRPAEYPNGACVWFKSLYETWSVWGLLKSTHICIKNTEQSKQE